MEIAIFNNTIFLKCILFMKYFIKNTTTNNISFDP